MPRFMHNDVLDAASDFIIANADRCVVFDAYSDDFATIETAKLAEYAPTFAKANGDESGRKLTLQAKSNIAVTAGGDFNHFALIDDTSSKVLHVGVAEITNSLNQGDIINCPAADIELSAPAAPAP